MKEVYLVMFYNGESYEEAVHSVDAVCSTKEKAEEVARLLTEQDVSNSARYDELCQLSNERALTEAEDQEMNELYFGKHVCETQWTSKWKYYVCEATVPYYE